MALNSTSEQDELEMHQNITYPPVAEVKEETKKEKNKFSKSATQILSKELFGNGIEVF